MYLHIAIVFAAVVMIAAALRTTMPPRRPVQFRPRWPKFFEFLEMFRHR